MVRCEREALASNHENHENHENRENHERIVCMFLAIAGFLLVVVPVPYRFWATSRLLRGYAVDDYLRDPRARKLWISNFALAFAAPLGIALLGFASRIWWVEMWTSIIAFAVTSRIVWKLWIRLSGRHHEYYRQMQWSGPSKRIT